MKIFTHFGIEILLNHDVKFEKLAKPKKNSQINLAIKVWK